VTEGAVEAGVAGRRKQSRPFGVRARAFSQRWALVGVLGLLIVTFSAWQPKEFATWSNAQGIINTQPPLLFVALGAIFVLLVGEFDLSVGATLGICQYLVLWLMSSHGMTWPLAIVITLGVGLLIGLVNAALVLVVGINCFVATIGSASVLTGILSWVSNNSTPIYTGAPQSFQNLAQSKFLGLTLPVYYAIVAGIVLWLMLEYMVLGREMRATGENRQAAILSGLRTNTAVTLGFSLAAVGAAIGGIIATARIGSADATSGPSYLLPAYAAALLGSTAVRPGFYNVWGTFVALFVVAVGVEGLQLAGADTWVTDVFNGGVLLVAVSMSLLVTRFGQGSKLRGRLRAIARTFQRERT
jgi:ribose transport system permease protein